MTSLHEILNKTPSDYFLAVVDMDGSFLIGIIDDPIGISLSELRLQYPLEFMARSPSPSRTELGYIVPELGVPDETVIDAGTADLHMGGSPLGLSYFAALKSLVRGPTTSFEGSIIRRPEANKGGANGAVRK